MDSENWWQSFRPLVICVSFCVTSSATVLFNKHLFEEKIFPHSNALVFVQSFFAVMLLSLGRRSGVISRFHIPTLQLKWPSADTFEPRRLAMAKADFAAWLTAVTYSLSVTTGLFSLSFLSVPMFSALKRCSIVPQWLFEFWFARQRTTIQLLPSLGVMLLGVIVAARNDLGFSGFGIALAAFSCVLQAASFELSRRVAKAEAEAASIETQQFLCTAAKLKLRESSSRGNSGVVSVLFANSAVSAVVVFCYLLVSGEVMALSVLFSDLSVCAYVFGNAVMCLLLNYLIFLDCYVNTPLTHVVAGHVKTLLTSVASVLFWEAHLGWPLGWFGIGMNAAGAAWFSGVKWLAAAKKREEIARKTFLI